MQLTLKADQVNRPYDCKIHITSDLKFVREQSSPVKFFDYYVFLIDPKFVTCLKEVSAVADLGEG